MLLPEKRGLGEGLMKIQSRRAGGTAVIGLGIFLIGAAIASAQQAGSPEQDIDTSTVTRVTLGSAQGTAGMSVVVPVYFAPASTAQIGQLKFDVTFVSENLKFTVLERGIAADMGTVDFKTTVKSQKNDKNLEVSTVSVEAATPGPGKTAIPSGLLGFLSLKISESGRAAKISLRPTVQARFVGSLDSAANVRGFDGFVEVFAPGELPNVNCFFFTH